MSTALNSNALNVLAGLMIPAAIVGLGARSGQTTLIAVWYAGLTIVALGLAFAGHGLTRVAGLATVAGYVALVLAILMA